MPQSPSLFSQAKPENNCPNCLLMKLGGMLVQPEKQGILNLKAKSADLSQIKLYLTLKFNEQEEKLSGTSFKFGLRGGKLTLRWENGKISPASSILNGSFVLSEQLGQHNPEGSNSQNCVKFHLNQTKAQVKTNLKTQETTDIKRLGQFNEVSQVSNQGKQDNLCWVLSGNNTILKGLLKPTLLGTLTLTAKPCRVEATFWISPQDIELRDTTGLLPDTLSKKKRLVIERAIARRLMKRRLNPYLSRQILRYE